MDILNRVQLKHGQTCFFFVSSFEDPYIYLKFEGIVKEVHTVYESQTIYRIEPTKFLDTPEYVQKYTNRHAYKVFDLSFKLNKTKKFFTFSYAPNFTTYLQEQVKDKYLLEVSSATAFDNVAEMHAVHKQVCKYIIDKLQNTINEIKSIYN